MNIYVVTDIEGVAGVVTYEQAGRDGKGDEYERARRLLTGEVNAVVTACKDAGVDKVVVMDGHGNGYNFIVEDLHKDAEYVVGPKRTRTLEGLTDDFDGVILLGYHSMAGTKNGVLSHTQSSTSWKGYWVNDLEMGEIGQCAVLAGQLDIPIILVTGDTAACVEAKKLLPHVETVSVKEGYTDTCAKILPPSAAQDLIKKGVINAIKNIKSMKPYKVEFPLNVKIEFKLAEIAERYAENGWERVNDTTVTKIIPEPEGEKIFRIF